MLFLDRSNFLVTGCQIVTKLARATRHSNRQLHRHMNQIDIARDLDRHEMIRETARQFADRKFAPWRPSSTQASASRPSSTPAMAKLGMFGITVPEQLGGAGVDTVAYAHVMEESVARLCVGRRPMRPGGAGRHAARPRTARAEQQPRYLRPLLARQSGAAPTASPRPRRAPTCRGSKPHAAQGRRRLAAQRRQALDPQRAGCRFRRRAGAHRPRTAGKRGMSIFIVD